MRLVNAFLALFGRTRRGDPVFGSMLYMGDRVKYWEGNARFGPAGSVIEVFVDGLAEDGMEQQHEFFRQLLHEWPNLRDKIGGKLLDESEELKANISVESLWDLFKVSSVSIPKGSIEDAEWEISFAASRDSDNLWTVRMKGRQPQDLVVEG